MSEVLHLAEQLLLWLICGSEESSGSGSNRDINVTHICQFVLNFIKIKARVGIKDGGNELEIIVLENGRMSCAMTERVGDLSIKSMKVDNFQY